MTLDQRKDESVDDHNAAVKIKARVEHRLGEVLAATVKHKGRPKKSDTVSDFPRGRVPKEIPPRQSSRTQKLARIPWEQIEEAIDAKTEANEKASQAGVVKELLDKQKRADDQVLAAESMKKFKGHRPPVEIANCIDYLRSQKPDSIDRDRRTDMRIARNWDKICPALLAVSNAGQSKVFEMLADPLRRFRIAALTNADVIKLFWKKT